MVCLGMWKECFICMVGSLFVWMRWYMVIFDMCMIDVILVMVRNCILVSLLFFGIFYWFLGRVWCCWFFYW